ncbi:MAG: hypothetical protein ACKOUS_01140 [Alphaproteobacteria bacterium]
MRLEKGTRGKHAASSTSPAARAASGIGRSQSTRPPGPSAKKAATLPPIAGTSSRRWRPAWRWIVVVMAPALLA